MSSDIIAQRTTSAFPLSIGTALAFESLSQTGGAPYDPDRIIPNIINLGVYNKFYINLSTVFRNLHGSMESADAALVGIDDYVQTMLSEVELMDDLVWEETLQKYKPDYYVCNYRNLKGLSSLARVRSPTTEKQRKYHQLYEKVTQKVVNAMHDRGQRVNIYNNSITGGTKQKTLIFSHVAYDLLLYKQVGELDLIESHTGVLKKRNTWHTKFINGKDLPFIPFHENMLKVFGDKVTFAPLSGLVRQQVVETAKLKKWTWASTEDRVMQSLSYLKDRLVYDTIKNL